MNLPTPDGDKITSHSGVVKETLRQLTLVFYPKKSMFLPASPDFSFSISLLFLLVAAFHGILRGSINWNNTAFIVQS